MIQREKIVDLVKAGRAVRVQLNQATIVSIKEEREKFGYGITWGSSISFNTGIRKKIVVRDPQIGTVWFSSFSSKFDDVQRGDRLTLKVDVNGVGDPSEKYPEPILFAKTNTRAQNSVTVTKHA